jgi:hypothetical protein
MVTAPVNQPEQPPPETIAETPVQEVPITGNSPVIVPEIGTITTLESPDKPSEISIIKEEEEKGMNEIKATFFYDKNIVEFYSDKSIKRIALAYFYFKDKKYESFDNDISLNSKIILTANNDIDKFIVYKDNLFYVSTDNKLYMINLKSKVETLINNNPYNYKWFLTETGIYGGMYFIDVNGIVYQSDNVGYNGYDHIIKAEKSGGYNIYFDNGLGWQKIKYSTVTNYFNKSHSYKYDNKIIFSRGATIDLVTMKQDEPFFNTSTKLYQGGNIFTQFIQPRYEQPKFYFIGDKDGIIYCLNAMNGKLYKYNYADNTLTEWIKIVDGCGVDEYLASDNLWFSMNPIMVDNEIIYYDGSKIKRFNVVTQENIIIAEATNFKGWKE